MDGQRDVGVAREFADIVGEPQLLTGDGIGPDYHHDEALVGGGVAPQFVARPQTAEQVAALLAAAGRAGVPVTARGSGTGCSTSGVTPERNTWAGLPTTRLPGGTSRLTKAPPAMRAPLPTRAPTTMA